MLTSGGTERCFRLFDFMINNYSRTTLILIALLVLGILSFTFKSPDRNSSSQALNARYQSNLNSLEKALQVFLQNIEAPDVKYSYYHDVRDAYQRVELFADHLDHAFVNRFINGAPLPKIMDNVPELSIIAPEGLQVLDEILFEDTFSFNDAKTTTQNLLNKVSEMKKLHSVINITDRHFFEAVQKDLIRISSFSITGFDTPGSLLGIEDTKTSLQEIQENFAFYSSQTQTNEQKIIAKELNHTITNAIKFIDLSHNQDFDNFDRYTFIQEYINPLFAIVFQMQIALDIEVLSEVYPHQKTAVNADAKSIFSSYFLNKNYFVNQKPNQDYKSAENLGKLLFFDPALSSNNKRACASCHNPQKGFTDGLTKSLAFDFKGHLDRNSPTIINAIYSDRFFWDLRAQTMEDQVQHVVTSPKEFNHNFPKMIEKLSSSVEYKSLFTAAFPNHSPQISKANISAALAAYMKTLSSFNSQFDKGIRGELKLEKNIINGFNLFMGKGACGSCHFAPTFSGLVPPNFKESESEVLGVPATNDAEPALDGDLGRFGPIIKEKADFYKHSFKTMTVRNIELTAPYMHNGVFQTLDEVMNFYNNGGGSQHDFELEHQTLSSSALGLSDAEKADIIAFMKSLTDTTGLTSQPISLPKIPSLPQRKIGGEY